NTVTLTVNDGSGNSTTCGATITIVDTLPPEFIPVSDITVDAPPGSCGTEINYPEISASDNCLAEIFLIEGNGTGGTFPVGITKEIYIATDPSGNSDTLLFNVTVNAVNANPTILDIPYQQIDEDSELTIELSGISDGDECYEQQLSVIAYTNNMTGIAELAVSYNNGDPEGLLSIEFMPDWNGEKTIYIDVEDEEGAITTVSFKVTVIPVNDPPVLVNPIPDFEVHAAHVLQIPVPNQLNNIFNDPDKDILSISSAFNGNTTAPSYIYFRNDTITVSPMIEDTGLVVVVVTATDPSGATASDTFNILVKGYITNIENPDMDLNVKLYPNPTDGILKFEINNARILIDPQIEIYNSEGKKVFQTRLEGSLLEINLRNQVSGNYFLKFISGEKEIIRQFIFKKE
ncbi:MAG: HYR domain-containing protein, partial [Prolixibacteraceae bacterium]|nr:HYR domain-containing protein [Prolixibacteraceae bacterium]